MTAHTPGDSDNCEQELRALKAVLASTQDFVYVFDRNGKYTYINRALLDVFHREMGLDESQVLGKNFSELSYPPELVRKYGDQLQEVIATGQSVRGDEVLPSSDGELREYEYIFSPVFDEEGRLEAVTGISRDVTELKDTMSALQQSENLYRALFESADEGIGLLEVLDDEEGPIDIRWLEVNEAFEERSGLRDPVGKRGRELTPNADESWFELYRDVAVSGEPAHFINYVEDTDRWFDVQAVPAGGLANPRVAVLFSDITERKRREHNAALLDELHDDFARLSDSEAIMASVGQKVAEYLGISRITFSRIDQDARLMTNLYDWHEDGLPSASGVHALSDFMPEQFIQDFQAGRPAAIADVSTDERTAKCIEAYKSFGVGSMLHVPHISDGRWKFQLAIHHGHIHHWRDHEIQLMTDLTERLYWRLERAFAEEELREANRRKDRFLAVLSHELRNPLAPIELGLQLLDQAGPNRPQGQRARTIIGRQVKQLTRLVDDLLDVNRINNNKIELRLKQVELNELVERTAEDHRPLFAEKGVELHLIPSPQPVFVQADPNRLAQVVGNLLHNAVKFTDPGDSTTVSVALDSGSDNGQISVADTGIGISPDRLESLFDPFIQADTSLEHSIGGLGLGLALVKGLVEMHDGKITARSDGLGQGAEFIICLPLDKSERSQLDVPQRQSPSPSRKILVIDDNVDIAELLQTVLTNMGHQVRVAHSGPTGIERARQFHPHVVICDIGLPEMNGYEVARSIRDDPELGNSYLIALSGYAAQEDIDRSRRSGFDRHLSKPPDLVELQQILTQSYQESRKL